MKFLRNFCCLLFQALQLRHNFWNLPIGFIRGSAHVARRGEIVVVLCYFLGGADLDEVRHVFAGNERVGNLVNTVLGNVVFRLAFLEFGAGVDEDDFALTRLRFLTVEDNDDAGRGHVVEKIVGKQDHAAVSLSP